MLPRCIQCAVRGIPVIQMAAAALAAVFTVILIALLMMPPSPSDADCGIINTVNAGKYPPHAHSEFFLLFLGFLVAAATQCAHQHVRCGALLPLS